jgi:hypothetical protein
MAGPWAKQSTADCHALPGRDKKHDTNMSLKVSRFKRNVAQFVVLFVRALLHSVSALSIVHAQAADPGSLRP